MLCGNRKWKERLKMDKEAIRKTFFQIEQTKRKAVQNYLREIGLTPGQGQARILQYLAGHEPVTQKKLAQECDLDVTTLSRVLDRLEKEGYLTRMPNPECRRSYLVALTQAGYEKADEVKVGFSRLEEKMCAGLTEEEGETLLALLKKVQKQRL